VRKIEIRPLLWLAVPLLLLPAACGPAQSDVPPAPTSEAGMTATESSETAVPTAGPTAVSTDLEPTSEFQVPEPDPGMANVVGRILWNGQPAEELGLLLCEDLVMLVGCGGAEYDSRTDAEGVFLFRNVAPGEYTLVVESFGGDHWLLVTSDLESDAGRYAVPADQTLHIPDYSIYRFDLILTYPGEGESVADGKPELTWEPYPDAAYYRVSIRREDGSDILAGEKTETPSIIPAVDLAPGAYVWQVEAYNASDTKIAEHDGEARFTVVG
jgi:hypothetical protein